jgi:AcrR family transcriptional regulator
VAPRRYNLGRRAAAAAETRQRVIEAAIAVYRDQGLGAATIKAVAERADVSRGTVLHHFDGGEGLLAAVLDHALASLDLPDARVLDGVADPAERGRQFVAAMFRFYDRTSDWWRVFAGERNELPANPALAAATSRYEAAIGQFLAAALGPLAADRITAVTVGTLIAPTTYYPLLGAGLSVDETIAVVGDLVAGLITGRAAGHR